MDTVRTDEMPTPNEIRLMVEDSWRRSLTFAVNGSAELGQEVLEQFENKIGNIALSLDDDKAVLFLHIVENERNTIFEEYTKSPEALKQRLGVKVVARRPSNSAARDLGNLAVKTAVRASVWSAIWKLFR